MKKLIGRNVKKIFMNDENLYFETDKGFLHYTVEGDCCSYSYFHDFIGVKKLLNNGPVISIDEIENGVGNWTEECKCENCNEEIPSTPASVSTRPPHAIQPSLHCPLYLYN